MLRAFLFTALERIILVIRVLPVLMQVLQLVRGMENNLHMSYPACGKILRFRDRRHVRHKYLLPDMVLFCGHFLFRILLIRPRLPGQWFEKDRLSVISGRDSLEENRQYRPC